MYLHKIIFTWHNGTIAGFMSIPNFFNKLVTSYLKVKNQTRLIFIVDLLLSVGSVDFEI